MVLFRILLLLSAANFVRGQDPSLRYRLSSRLLTEPARQLGTQKKEIKEEVGTSDEMEKRGKGGKGIKKQPSPKSKGKQGNGKKQKSGTSTSSQLSEQTQKSKHSSSTKSKHKKSSSSNNLDNIFWEGKGGKDSRDSRSKGGASLTGDDTLPAAGSMKSEGKRRGSSKTKGGTESSLKGKGNSSKSKKRSSSKRKGGGKSKGKGGGKTCVHPVASAILDTIPEATVATPQRCCNEAGSISMFVTHARRKDSTLSGLEDFWDAFYTLVDASTEREGTCFIITGYDQDITTESTLSEILVKVNEESSKHSEVAALMSSDPTDDTLLVDSLRVISDNAESPQVGVFNSGWGNLVIESLVSGKDRLPFIGYLDDAAFGTEAAMITKQLLEGKDVFPLCLNDRPDLAFVGIRCSNFYTALTDAAVIPEIGVVCSAETTPENIIELINNGNINAILAHTDCCVAAAEAVAMVRATSGKSMAIGCTDEDKSDGLVDYVTTQPVMLQAHQASAWTTSLLRGIDRGASAQYFPALASLTNTAIFSQLMFRSPP